MRSPTWLRALHLFTILTLLPLPLTPAFAAEAAAPPSLTDKDKAAPLFRASVTLESEYAWTRLVADLRVTVLHRQDASVAVLVDSDQLDELARLRYAPTGVEELGALVAAPPSGAPNVRAAVQPLLARAASAQAVALTEGHDSTAKRDALASLRDAVRGLSNDVRMMLAVLPSSDSDGDGLTNTEEQYWCTDKDDARSRNDPNFTDKDFVDRIRQYLLRPDLRDDRIGGPPFQGWPSSGDVNTSFTSSFNHPGRQIPCPDSDKDGVPDGAERLLGLNVNLRSTDGDRYDDGVELWARDKDGNPMPSYVRAPGTHPMVAALPIIEIDIATDRQGKDAFYVTPITVITSGTTEVKQEEVSYTTAKTEGTSSSVADTVTWNNWQESSTAISVPQTRVISDPQCGPLTPLCAAALAAGAACLKSKVCTFAATQIAKEAGKQAFNKLVKPAASAVWNKITTALKPPATISAPLDLSDYSLILDKADFSSQTGCGLALGGTAITCIPPASGLKVVGNVSPSPLEKAGVCDPGECYIDSSGQLQIAKTEIPATGAPSTAQLQVQPTIQITVPAAQPVPVVTTTESSGHSTGGAQTTTHTDYEERTVTNGNSILTGQEWSNATALNTLEAGKLRFGYTVKNTGADWAQRVCNVTFNLFIGDDPIPAAKYQVGASDFAGRDGVESGCFLNFEPGEGHVYTTNTSQSITLTLDQLRAIDTFAPIRIVVEDYTLGVDDQLISNAYGAGVMIAIEDGTDDDNESVDRYLIPTFGPTDKVQDVITRYFPHQLDATGDIVAIWTPEFGRNDAPPWCDQRRDTVEGIWCRHALTTADWWNIYLSGLGNGDKSLSETEAQKGGTAFFRFNADSDFDGYSDRSETRLDTNPFDPASHPKPELLGGLHCLAPDGDNKVVCTLSLLNTGPYDAYGVEAIMAAPDDTIAVTNNTVGGSGRVRAGRQVIVGSSVKVQDPLPPQWTQANHARPAAGGYYTGATDRTYTFTVSCQNPGGCDVGSGVWSIGWTDGVGGSGAIGFGSGYGSPSLQCVGGTGDTCAGGLGLKLSLLSGRVFPNETFTVAARTPRDTFQYTINEANPTEPIVIVSYNDPQGNHRFVLPTGPAGSMDLGAPTDDLKGFSNKMLLDPGVEIVTIQAFAVGANTTNLVVNNPTEKTLVDAKLFLEFISTREKLPTDPPTVPPAGTVVLEVPVTQTLKPGPTVVDVTWNTASFAPAYDIEDPQDYIVLAFLTDYQGNILDTGGRPLSSFQADPRPALETDGNLTWDFGSAAQGTLLQKQFPLASTGFMDLRTYIDRGAASEISVNGQPARVLSPGDLALYTVTLNTDGQPLGPYSKTIEVRSSDPDANQRITISGQITAATPDPIAGSTIKPLEYPAPIPGAGTKGTWVQFDHTLGPDPQTLHPVRVLGTDGADWGVGKYATPFGAGNTSFDIFGNGMNGDYQVGSGEDLNPVQASASGAAGQNALTVGSVTGFAVNTKVLVHQTRGTGAGLWEMNEIQSISGSDLIMKTALKNRYYTGPGADRAQVLWVPQYRNMTIPAGVTMLPKAWDGNTGGILAFTASGTFNVASGATLSADGRGFRGAPTNTSGYGGSQGEAEPGLGTQSTAANGEGGGGGCSKGYGNPAGGGGGGYGSQGTRGNPGNNSDCDIPGAGGGTAGDANLVSAVLFGGGGGSGGAKRPQDGNYPGGFGGAGGGIIVGFADTATLSGRITANGTGGGLSSGFNTAANGGGGAGGSILLTVRQGTATGIVTSNGGPGGLYCCDATQNGGPGGNGRVHLRDCDSFTGATAPVANTDKLTCYIAEQLDTAPYTTTRLNLPETITTGRTYNIQYGRRLQFAGAATSPTTYLRIPRNYYTAGSLDVLVSNTGASSGPLDLKLFIGDDATPDWVYNATTTFPTRPPLTASGFVAALNDFMSRQTVAFGTPVDVPVRVQSNRQADIILTNLILGTQTTSPRILESVVNLGADRPLDKAVNVPAGMSQGATYDFSHQLNQDDLSSIQPCLVYDQSVQTLKGVGKYCASAGQGTASADMFGDGRNGDKTAVNGENLNPTWASARGTASSNNLEILNAGDAGGGVAFANIPAPYKVMIHQTRGTNAGAWELNDVLSADSGSLTLRKPLTNTYTTDSGSNPDSGVSRTQVLWMPQYHNLTVPVGVSVSPLAWDGYTGGIIAVLVSGQMNAQGDILANGQEGNIAGPFASAAGAVGRGFHGGDAASTNGGTAQTGEGVTGDRVSSTVSNSNGGGAGRTNGENRGHGATGGGGANRGAGQSGSASSGVNGSHIGGAGGVPYLPADSNILLFGGGAGGAAKETGAMGASGSSGGGVAFIGANYLSLTGKISTNGGNGKNTIDFGGSVGGSGGAGGSILLLVGTGTVSSTTVTARGGTAGRGAVGGAEGAAGGDGRIHIKYCNSSPGTTTPTPTSVKLSCYIADQSATDAMQTILTLPEASGSGTSYQVQYGRQYSFTGASPAPLTKKLRLRKQPYGSASLDALVSNVSGGSLSLSLALGSTSPVTLPGFPQNLTTFPQTVPVTGFVDALNQYLEATADAYGSLVDVPVQVTVSGPADVVLTNLALTPGGAKTRYLRLPARQYSAADLTLKFGQTGAASSAVTFAVDVGDFDAPEWSGSATAPGTVTSSGDASTWLLAAINGYLLTRSGEAVDIPVRIIVPSADVTVSLSGATVRVQGKPDLRVAPAPADWFSVTEPSEGAPVTVTVPIENTTGTASGPVTVSFFATPPASGQATPAPVYIGAVLVLDVPGTSTVPTPPLVWNTLGFTGAAVPVLAVINPFESIPEASFTNNTASKGLRILTRADLAVVPATGATSGITLDPPEPVRGKPVQVTVNLRNSGETPALAGDDDHPTLVLNEEFRLDAAAATFPTRPLGSDPGAVGPGVSQPLVFTWTPDAPGPYRLYALSDTAGRVSESNEGNNQTWTDVYVGFSDARTRDSGPGEVDYAASGLERFGAVDANDVADELLRCGDGQRADDTYRRDGGGLVTYRFDHLQPSRFYHVDVVMRECDNVQRRQTVQIDGLDVSETVELAVQLAQGRSFRIDPALYADRTITATIKAEGIDGAVVSSISVREVYYRYADAGSPAKNTAGKFTKDPSHADGRGYGWLSASDLVSAPSTAWGSAPLQSARVASGNTLKYRFDGLQQNRRYAVRMTLWQKTGVPRTQKVEINDQPVDIVVEGQPLPTVVTVVGPESDRTDGTIPVPAGLYTAGTITVAIIRTDAQGGAFVNEIALEEETLITDPPGIRKLSAGDNQLGLPSSTLPTPLAVEIRDAVGVTVPGVAVAFALTAPAGSTGHRLTAGDLSDVTLVRTSNADGKAEVSLILGSIEGVYTVSATCLSCSAPQAVSFQATAQNLIQHHIEKVSPTGAVTGKTRRLLTDLLTVRVVSSTAAPLGGVAVSFAVTPPASSGATAQLVFPLSATTDAQGQAATRLLLGEVPGLYTVTATCGGCSAAAQVTFPVTAKSAYQEAVMADAPRGYWRLNEAAGVATAVDVSGNANTGTYVGGMTTIATDALPGEGNNRAAQSDGVDDYITVPDSVSLSPTAAVSLEAWVNITAYTTSVRRIVSRPGAYELSVYTQAPSAGRVELKLFTGVAGTESNTLTGTTAADRLVPGQWHHVVATYDGTAAHIHIDGVLRRDNPVTGAVRDATGPLTISRSGFSVPAKLDEVAVYGTALSAAAVGRHYRAGRPETAAAAAVSPSSGDGQRAAISTPLANLMVVTVTDVDGNPVPGKAVNWQIGTVPSGAAGQTLLNVQAATDPSGRASARLQLGDRPGSYAVTATVTGVTPASFTGTALGSGGSLLLFFDPVSSPVGLNAQPVDIVIRADSGGQPVDSVQFEITFDPVKLLVIDTDPVAPGINLIPGLALPEKLRNEADNAAGRIRYAAGLVGSDDAPSGIFTLATVRLRGVGAGATPLAFSQTGTDAFSQGATLQVTRDAGTVNVAARQLAFLAQPVRGAHGYPFGIQPRVELRDAGGAVQTADTTTVITLAIKPGAGAANAVLTCDETVGAVTAKTVSGGSATFVNCRIDRSGASYQLVATTQSDDATTTSAMFNVTFAGDINGDCEVSLSDFSLLAAHFDKTPASSDWSSGVAPAYRADINGSNSVGLDDFSILRAAFGQTAVSCEPPGLGATLRLAPAETNDAERARVAAPPPTDAGGIFQATATAVGTPVRLQAVASRGAPTVGETVEVAIHAATGTQMVDGIEVAISYPVSLLEAVLVTPGTTLPTVLANRTDAATGRVRLALGQSLTAPAPSGDFVLATVQFRARAAGPAPIALVSPVAAYAAGTRIVAETTDSAITIAPIVTAPVGGTGGGGDGSSSVPTTPASSTPAPPSTTATGTIDSSRGGTQTTLNVTASIPAGVVSGGGALAVAVSERSGGGTPSAPDGSLLGSTVFEVTLQDSRGNEVHNLDQAATLAAKFTAADLALAGGDPSRLRLQRFDEATQQWVDLGGVVDPATMTITASTGHFSLFAVTALLPVPALNGPADGALVVSMDPALTWNNPPDVQQYQVQVLPFNGDGPAINLIIGAPELVAAARFTVPAPKLGEGDYILLPGMTYTWRVRTTPLATPLGEHDSGWSAWSSVRTFRSAPPTSVTISPLQPALNSEVTTQTPVLQWANANDRVFYYELQLSADPQFVTDPAAATASVYWELVHGGTTAPQNSYAVKQEYRLDTGTTYYWRIRPRVQGDGVPVDWTDTWSFRTP